jgi:hypothetical protein
MLVVLTVAPWAPGATKKDQNYESTHVYQHTYDEVFQASQEAIERLGYFVTGKDKDKGTISGNDADGRISFDIHIEALNTKPETRVTMNVKFKWCFSCAGSSKDAERRLSIQLQKVLATYH